tara:strand:- start:89 stop:319 length:231 start_codon:yes stop_codon:yes gene_type:complete
MFRAVLREYQKIFLKGETMKTKQNELIARTESEVNYLLRSKIESSEISYTGEELNKISKGLIKFFRAEVQNFLNDF